MGQGYAKGPAEWHLGKLCDAYIILQAMQLRAGAARLIAWHVEVETPIHQRREACTCNLDQSKSYKGCTHEEK
eukprot:scaffold64468_cov13-Tisochrysis_lutea.AAC.1